MMYVREWWLRAEALREDRPLPEQGAEVAETAGVHRPMRCAEAVVAISANAGLGPRSFDR